MNNPLKVFIAFAVPIIFIGTVLFIIDLFSNDDLENQEEKNIEIQEYETSNDNDEENEKSSESGNKSDEKEEINEADGELLESIDKVEPAEKEEGNPTLEEVFGKKTAKKSKQVAEKFIKSFYGFDGDKPQKSIENAKDYITDELYQELLKDEIVPTHNMFYRRLKSIEYHETMNSPTDKEDDILLFYIVEGEYTDILKENKTQITDTILIRVIEVDDDFKVEKFGFNIPF